MKSSSRPGPLRQAALLGLAAAALLCARSASAQAAPFTYQVINDTFSGGDPNFSVTDDLTFTNLLITETFSGGSTLSLPLADLDTGTTAEESSPFSFDPARGYVQSAVLTGSLDNGLLPGAEQTVNLQTSFGGPVTPQLVYTNFSTDLLAPSQSGIGIGQIALLFNGSPVLGAIQINASPVPEASTVVSMGLMLALGFGGLVVTRRRRAAK